MLVIVLRCYIFKDLPIGVVRRVRRATRLVDLWYLLVYLVCVYLVGYVPLYQSYGLTFLGCCICDVFIPVSVRHYCYSNVFGLILKNDTTENIFQFEKVILSEC